MHGCPYCHRVIDFMQQSEVVDVAVRDIFSDDDAREDLVALGGKEQVPFFHDTDGGICMYESSGIIAHLGALYGAEASETLSQEMPNVCPIIKPRSE